MSGVTVSSPWTRVNQRRSAGFSTWTLMGWVRSVGGEFYLPTSDDRTV